MNRVVLSHSPVATIKNRFDQQDDDDLSSESSSARSTILTTSTTNNAVRCKSSMIVCETKSRVQQQQCEQYRHRPREVTFVESRNVQYRNNVLSQEECYEQWYQAHDFKRFKAELYDLVRAFRRGDRKKTSTRNDHEGEKSPSLGSCNEFQSAMMNCWEACDDQDKRQTKAKSQTKKSIFMRTGKSKPCYATMQRDLSVAYTTHPERLGAERLAIAGLYQDKMKRRRHLVSAVLRMQWVLNEDESFRGVSRDQKIETIQKVSERISRRSRWFAQEVGLALAHS